MHDFVDESTGKHVSEVSPIDETIKMTVVRDALHLTRHQVASRCCHVDSQCEMRSWTLTRVENFVPSFSPDSFKDTGKHSFRVYPVSLAMPFHFHLTTFHMHTPPHPPPRLLYLSLFLTCVPFSCMFANQKHMDDPKQRVPCPATTTKTAPLAPGSLA